MHLKQVVLVSKVYTMLKLKLTGLLSFVSKVIFNIVNGDSSMHMFILSLCVCSKIFEMLF